MPRLTFAEKIKQATKCTKFNESVAIRGTVAPKSFEIKNRVFVFSVNCANTEIFVVCMCEGIDFFILSLVQSSQINIFLLFSRFLSVIMVIF